MTCSLQAPCHYLTQCWFIISKVLWHSPQRNSRVPKLLFCSMSLKIIFLRLLLPLPGVNELTYPGVIQEHSPNPRTFPSLNSPSYFIPSHRWKTPTPLNFPSPNSPSYLRRTIYRKVSSRLHQMETFSTLLALCAGNSPVTGEFPSQRPVTRSFDVFFDLRPNKRLNKQLWGWWFQMPSRSL